MFWYRQTQYEFVPLPEQGPSFSLSIWCAEFGITLPSLQQKLRMGERMDALGGVWPAGRGRISFPSTLPW